MDPVGGQPRGCAPRVVERARQHSANPERFQDELLTSQVESTTGVCPELTEVTEELLAGRRALAAAAGESGAVVLPTGTAPVAGLRVPLGSGERFERIHTTHREVIADYQVCGCHVHVGVPDEETAVRVVDQVRPWLPTLLALSTNSPFHNGRNTGFVSWRMLEQARLPGSGIPPVFESAAAYHREVGRLTAYGCLVDAQMSFWLARPSPSWPTVEFRVADTAATVDEAVLQAALARALVTTALSAVAAGRPPPVMREQTAAAAVWSAARHGIRGPAVDPWAERPVAAVELVRRLLEEVADSLRASGDQEWVTAQVDLLVTQGTGAERQLRAAQDGGADVLLTHLAQELTRPPRGARTTPAVRQPVPAGRVLHEGDRP